VGLWLGSAVLRYVRDHAALQDAHRALVAKDLMKSGLLKDMWVGRAHIGC
jgi:hypothetical protein